MYRAHKPICSGKATTARTIDARTVGGIYVTLAAIKRRGNVTCRFGDHSHAIMRLAVMATGAIVGDACSSMVEGR